MRLGKEEWPLGRSHLLAAAGTMTRYAMGKAEYTVARLCPELCSHAPDWDHRCHTQLRCNTTAGPLSTEALAGHGPAP